MPSPRRRPKAMTFQRELAWVELELLRTGSIISAEANRLVYRDPAGTWTIDDQAAEAAFRQHFDAVQAPIPPDRASWAAVRYAGATQPVWRGRYGHLRATL